MTHFKCRRFFLSYACRNGRLSESLTAANELTDRVAAENQQLQRDASERERENFEVGEYLRKDLADRKRELAELNDHKQEVWLSLCQWLSPMMSSQRRINTCPTKLLNRASGTFEVMPVSCDRRSGWRSSSYRNCGSSTLLSERRLMLGRQRPMLRCGTMSRCGFIYHVAAFHCCESIVQHAALTMQHVPLLSRA